MSTMSELDVDLQDYRRALRAGPVVAYLAEQRILMDWPISAWSYIKQQFEIIEHEEES